MRWRAVGLMLFAFACSPEEDLPPGCPEIAVPDGVYESDAGGAVVTVEGDVLTLTRGPTVTRYRIAEYGRYTSHHASCGPRPAGHGLRTVELLPGATTTRAVVRVSTAPGDRLADPIATSSTADVAAPSLDDDGRVLTFAVEGALDAEVHATWTIVTAAGDEVREAVVLELAVREGRARLDNAGCL